MYTMQDTQATLTGATTANVCSGKVFERSPVNGMARISLVGEAAGESRATVYIGGRVIYPEGPISRQNRVPVMPDDVLMTTPIGRGEQIVISIRNTGGGTNTIFWRVDIKPR